MKNFEEFYKAVEARALLAREAPACGEGRTNLEDDGAEALYQLPGNIEALVARCRSLETALAQNVELLRSVSNAFFDERNMQLAEATADAWEDFNAVLAAVPPTEGA